MASNDLQKAVDALVLRESARTVGSAPAAAPIPAVAGRAVAQAPSNQSQNGGLAAPLTEVPGSREYYLTAQNTYSSDGLMLIKVYPLKKLTMTDADGATVVFNYAEP